MNIQKRIERLEYEMAPPRMVITTAGRLKEEGVSPEQFAARHPRGAKVLVVETGINRIPA